MTAITMTSKIPNSFMDMITSMDLEVLYSMYVSLSGRIKPSSPWTTHEQALTAFQTFYDEETIRNQHAQDEFEEVLSDVIAITGDRESALREIFEPEMLDDMYDVERFLLTEYALSAGPYQSALVREICQVLHITR